MNKDKLDEIFEMQAGLEEKVLANPENAARYGSTKEQRIRNVAMAIIHEGVELQRLTNFKWWKQFKGFDEQAAREELIDIWHFVVQGSLALKLTPDDVMEDYRKKMAVNQDRVKNGY